MNQFEEFMKKRAEEEAKAKAISENVKSTDGSDPMLKVALGQAALTLIPVLAGAAFGGTSGAAAGAEAGRKGTEKLTDTLSKREEKETELKIKKAEKEDERSFQTKLQEQKLKGEKDIAMMKQVQEKLPTKEQGLAATFAIKAKMAEEALGNINFDDYNPTTFGGATQRLVGKYIPTLAPKQEREIAQAETSFVNSILRDESGAAITESEVQSAREQYFPRIGDTPEVIERKKREREVAVAGLRARAGEKATGAIESLIGATQQRQIKREMPQALPGGTSAVAGPKAPDFDSMSEEELRKYLGR